MVLQVVYLQTRTAQEYFANNAFCPGAFALQNMVIRLVG